MNRAEINFQDIIWALKRYFVWILLTTLLFTVGSWVYAKNFITPLYTTQISMVVFSDIRTDSGVTTSQLNADATIASTYAVLLRSQPVTQAVSKELGGEVASGTISGMISVANSGQVLYINVTASDPQIAYRVANALADVAPSAVGSLLRAGEMTLVNRAYLPTAPSSPDIPSKVALGAALGLMLSCAVVILIALLDTTVWREEDLEHLFNIPVLGSVPSMSPGIGNRAKGRK